MGRGSKLLLVLGAGLVLAACTPESPETTFNWGVNDRSAARAAPVRSAQPVRAAAARTYIYDGDNYAVPAPKPRPDYQPAQPAYQSAQPAYRPAYQPYDDRSQPVRASIAFAWPASGRVISGFGSSTNGERNDGINIALPMGAPIKAAASGTVSYSGSELKDYGNLLLIKHADGWTTAYAHNEKLLVAKGDTVVQGQVIANVGRTGNVDRPQLHFEVRRGTQAMDPLSYLAKTGG